MKRVISVIPIFFICISSYSQPIWEMVHGTDSSFTLANAFSTDTNHTWGTKGGSIYFSPDMGYTWELVFQNEDYNFADIFFLDSMTGWSIGWSEVLKTSDGGETWVQQILPNPLGMDVEDVYFINQDTGWIAGSYKMIYGTHDGGENWVLLHNYEITGWYFLYDIHFYDALHGCAVGGGMQSQQPLIMTTEDGGESWVQILPESYGTFENVQFISDSLVWACDRSGRLFRSMDAGFNWEIYYHWNFLNSNQMQFFNANNAIIASEFRQVITEDGWLTYDTVEFGLYDAISRFTYADLEHGLAIGNNNFLVTTDGGYNWARINERFYRIAFFNPMNGWIIQEHMNKKLMHSMDGGITWDEVETNQSGLLVEFEFPSDSTGYILSTRSELLKTSDAGNSWNIIYLPGNTNSFSDIQFLDENTGFLSARPDKIYKTINGGQVWEEITFFIPSSVSDIFFIDPLEGWLVGYDSICGHTTDGGQSWQYVKLPSDNLNEITFIDNNIGFITTLNNKAYRSSDGGLNWEEMDLFVQYPCSIEFTDSTHGWMTASRKIYRTEDAGLTWYENMDTQNSNWREEIMDLFLLDSINGWFCTMDGRVFTLSMEMGNDEIVQNNFISIFPNPVSDFLYIEFKDIVNEDFSLEIYSIEGKLLLKKDYTGDRNSRAGFNLSHLNRGLYLARIQGPAVRQTFKFIKY